MRHRENNYAFIDTQNVHLGVLALGWRLDWRRFRVHLAETYGVTVAYQFMGYIPRRRRMYENLRSDGYSVIHKPVTYRDDGRPKGNIDAELVLQAMIDFGAYSRAVIVTSDGDFACLVRHLRERRKLRAVVSPTHRRSSGLLRSAAGGQLNVLEDLRSKLESEKS